MAQLFFPKEIRDLEHRIAATPETVKKLIAAGYQVSVEAGAGEGAFISDDNYTQAGATVGDDLKSLYEAADIVVKIQAPQHHPGLDVHEAELLRDGLGCACVIARDHLDTDSGGTAFRDSGDRLLSWGINKADEPQKR